MGLTLEGTVKKIHDEFENEAKTFKKTEALITIDETSQYPQDIPIEAVNKNSSMFDAVNVGDVISVDINLRGNEFNGRNYVSINAWRLSITSKGTGVPDSDPAPIEPTGDATAGGDTDGAVDDLPF